jgi:hypothetical protein
MPCCEGVADLIITKSWQNDAEEQDAACAASRDVAKYPSRRGVKSGTDVGVHTAETDASHLLRLEGGRRRSYLTGAYGHSRPG